MLAVILTFMVAIVRSSAEFYVLTPEEFVNPLAALALKVKAV